MPDVVDVYDVPFGWIAVAPVPLSAAGEALRQAQRRWRGGGGGGGGPGGGGGGGGGAVPSSEYSRRFGEPVPGLVTLPVVALVVIALATVAGEAAGAPCRYSAATPATCGVAIDVPLIVFVAVSDVYQLDVMLEPGAKRSRQVP